MFPGSDVNAVWRRMAFIQRKEQQCGEDLMWLPECSRKH
jgi:hypothetical protein